MLIETIDDLKKNSNVARRRFSQDLRNQIIERVSRGRAHRRSRQGIGYLQVGLVSLVEWRRRARCKYAHGGGFSEKQARFSHVLGGF